MQKRFKTKHVSANHEFGQTMSLPNNYIEHTYMYVPAHGNVLMSITQHTIIRLLLSICLIPLQLIIYSL